MEDDIYFNEDITSKYLGNGLALILIYSVLSGLENNMRILNHIFKRILESCVFDLNQYFFFTYFLTIALVRERYQQHSQAVLGATGINGF